MYERTSSLSSSSREREAALARLETEGFDLLVIGGGITGAAIAHRAAGQGLRVALIEQGDFASGTSSRSSRLIHGGLRYLKHGQVRLVHRCLLEQKRLSILAPHLVRPLSLMLPLYHHSSAKLWAHRGGMALYRALQPTASGPFHQLLDAPSMRGHEPLLSAQGLQGGFLCREYLTHDARLVWETVLAATRAGACALNYVRLSEFITSRGRVTGGILRDELTGRTIEAHAKVVVNTTGPWSDRLTSRINPSTRRLRLTKGVHIILPRRLLPLSQAVIFFSPADKRPLVAIPSENLVIVGPTETEFEGEPGCAVPEPRDIEYLLEALWSFFPAFALSSTDVVARAGLRPLYDQSGKPAGEVSRAYHIEWQREGLLSVLGGKLTLHRQAAEEAFNVLAQKLGCAPPRRFAATLVDPLPGALWVRSPETVAEKLLGAGVAPESVAHLLHTYGSRALLFVDLLDEEPAGREAIAPPLPFIRAEALFSMRYEWAACAQDFTERRTDLALRAKVEGITLELDGPWRAAARESPVAYV
ncbi:MAG TPA: glycerol-3-phosphate dehydrogenase/oxidase [Pyrinomonadaceae bacterium]|jgi:glycerol-3-phosphate dehydrogenase|nr:glycerol-3-phosphate dehydrogenase/oxidase [Pyrinomonadaceae bacterium]